MYQSWHSSSLKKIQFIMILEKKENQTRTIKIAVYKKVIFHAWASLNLVWAIWAGQQIYELVGSKKVVWPFLNSLLSATNTHGSCFMWF